MLLGYARISTADLNPDHQVDALLRAGVEERHIHVDVADRREGIRTEAVWW